MADLADPPAPWQDLGSTRWDPAPSGYPTFAYEGRREGAGSEVTMSTTTHPDPGRGEYLPLPLAAEILNLDGTRRYGSYMTLRRRYKEGLLETFKVDGRRCCYVEDLDRLFSNEAEFDRLLAAATTAARLRPSLSERQRATLSPVVDQAVENLSRLLGTEEVA